MNKKGRVILCTFGAGQFAPRIQSFQTEAESVNLFSEVRIYTQDTLPRYFLKKHSTYMSKTKRGYGYWIWKPCVVLDALQSLEQDDVLVYVDIGCTLRRSGRERFLEYFDIARNSPWKMLSFMNTHTEYVWTKSDLANRLNSLNEAKLMATSQLASGLFILQNTTLNRELVRDWLSVATEENYHYIDDSPSRIPNHDKFIEHRHDASIFSLLRKKRGTSLTHYEVQPYDTVGWNKYKNWLPVHAERRRY